jgi:hypothetical protein
MENTLKTTNTFVIACSDMLDIKTGVDEGRMQAFMSGFGPECWKHGLPSVNMNKYNGKT